MSVACVEPIQSVNLSRPRKTKSYGQQTDNHTGQYVLHHE